MKLFDKINKPCDLRKLKVKDLKKLSFEIREFIINVMAKRPGHFGASLGTVELTVALHYVFNTPKDKLIWDVGHQAYTHKILTGRKDRFSTIRQLKGLSGFPNIFESEYDAFTVGHSSTSISASLGIAVSSALQNKDNQVVAIIGDGAMTGGLAYEALNNAGITKSNLLIILNDNNMSIDPNVVAINKYLTKVTSSRVYNSIKTRTWKMLDGKLLPVRNLFKKFGIGMKSTIIADGNFFESLGVRYFGPVNGHNVENLVQILSDLKKIPGPKILHCVTKKGKGYLPAEKNQTIWHAPGLFNPKTGEIIKSKSKSLKYQDVFGKTILELAKKNNKIVAISPAMISGSSLNLMQKEFPDRVFDVGIAEAHAVTFSAGLAIDGMTPFCVIYSSFLQRAYDQIIHDVAIQKLNVTICIDRGGFVGEDGATHHGAFDIAYLRLIPNVTIAIPMNGVELQNMIYTAQSSPRGLFTIRYPRGENGISELNKEFKEVEIGKGVCEHEGEDIAILTVGKPGSFIPEVIKKAGEVNISVAHYNMRFVKPLDEEMLNDIFKKHKNIITVEDGTIIGGFGSAVVEFMVENNYSSKIKKLGIPDKFIEHGSVSELYSICGFDSESILKQVLLIIKS